MPRILLDQNAPLGLRKHLKDHEVGTARYMGWEGMSNGDLIAAAEANAFDVIITADQNLRYQQSIADRKIAIVVLSTNHWATISRDRRGSSRRWAAARQAASLRLGSRDRRRGREGRGLGSVVRAKDLIDGSRRPRQALSVHSFCVAAGG
jgi:hypothetical protein